MKEFPQNFTPDNKRKFNTFRYTRNLAYLRKEVYEQVLLGDETNYFAIDNFNSKYFVSNEDSDKMVKQITSELEDLGWNVQKSFGGTALFIYSTSQPPDNCYDDTFC